MTAIQKQVMKPVEQPSDEEISEKHNSLKHLVIFALIGCLYFAGIAAILYPMISNVYSLSTSKTVISDYETAVAEMPDKVIETKFKNAEKYNSDIAKGIFNDGLEKSLCDNDGLMCYVDIPSISVYLPVYYGTTDEILRKGCGTLENTSLPVGGKSTHSVISGHTGLPSADMFTKLDQMEKGEVFYIHVLDRILAYKVVNIEAVTPDKTELLEVVKGKDYCTLLTCTPYGINDKRLLVRGERIAYNSETIQTKPAAASAGSDADDELAVVVRNHVAVIVAIALLAILVYIAALLWLIYTIIKRNSAPPKHLRKTEDENGDHP